MPATHFDIRELRRTIQLAFVRFLALTVVGVAGAAGSVGAQDPTLPGPPPLDTVVHNLGTIRAGDVINLTVFQTPELSGILTVDARGIIEIPGIGPVQVAGLQVFELDRAVRKAMEKIVLDPSFTTTVAIRVYVLGQVGAPKEHLVPPGTTLLAMLAIAGGESPAADLKRTLILRDNRTYEIDLEAGKRGGHQGRYTLVSNDYILIQRKSGFSRETITFVLSAITGIVSLINLAVALNR